MLHYDVRIHRLSAGKVGPPQTYTLRARRAGPGVEFAAVGRCIEMSVPCPGPSVSDGIMLSADSRLMNYLVDKTACVLLKTVSAPRAASG